MEEKRHKRVHSVWNHSHKTLEKKIQSMVIKKKTDQSPRPRLGAD